MSSNDQSWYQQSFERMIDPAIWSQISSENFPENKENIERSLTKRLAGIANEYFQRHSTLEDKITSPKVLLDRFLAIGIKNQWLSVDKMDMLKGLANQMGLINRSGRVKIIRGREREGISDIIIDTLQKMKKVEAERDESPVRKKTKDKKEVFKDRVDKPVNPSEQSDVEKSIGLIKDQMIIGKNPNKLDSYGTTILHHSIYSLNLELVKFLISKGVETDVPNKDGFSPLHIAASMEDSRYLEALLKGKGDIDCKDAEGRTALHTAVEKLRMQNVVLLVNRGVELNCYDKRGISPLEISIGNESYPIMSLLLDMGADPNPPPEAKWGPVFQAVSNGNLEALKKLHSLGARLFLISFDGLDPLTYLKLNRPVNYLEIKSILEGDEKVRQFSKEFLKRILLTHLSEVSLKTSIISSRFSLMTRAENFAGAESEFMYRKIEPHFKDFAALFPIHLSDEESKLVCKTIYLNEIQPQSIKNLMARWKAGKPVIVDAGYEGHYVSVVIWRNKFVICNRGEGQSDKSDDEMHTISSYSFDTEKLVKETLIKIQHVANKRGEEAYKKLFGIELPAKLNLRKTGLDRLFDIWSMPTQVIGNCTWANSEESIYVLLFLNELYQIDTDLENIPQDTVEEILSEKLQVMENFKVFMILKGLKKYAKWVLDPNNAFVPDTLRVDKIFERKISTRVIFADLRNQWESEKINWERVKSNKLKQPDLPRYHFEVHFNDFEL